MRIALLGCGKMGSWLATTLSSEHEVAAFDSDFGKILKIKNVIVLKSLPEIKKFAPELLLNAVSLQNTIQAFDSAVPFLPKECLICDVASVKQGLAEYYPKSGFAFCSVHPMFGPTFANLGLLEGENAVIISESDPKGKEFFRKIFTKLKLNIYDYSFSEHDQMMAYSLTTPFVSTLVFAACIDKSVVPGSTFAKHLKIARGLLSEDDSLLAEILFNENSVPQINKINSKLEHLKHIIMAKDQAEINSFLDKLRANIGQAESREKALAYKKKA